MRKSIPFQVPWNCVIDSGRNLRPVDSLIVVIPVKKWTYRINDIQVFLWIIALMKHIAPFYGVDGHGMDEMDGMDGMDKE